MKTLKTIILFAIYFSPLLWRAVGGEAFAQCLPLIAIDGNYIVADENNIKGLKLPAWLTAGQTLAKGQYVYSISVIEFTVNGTALDYSQNKKITTIETVPSGKVWKIESIIKDMALPSSSNGVYSYTNPGNFSFTTPACITIAQIQVWGGGGGGGSGNLGSPPVGSGGGGGGYSEGSYQLAASTTYNLTVGAGGVATGGWYAGSAGNTSSFTGPSTLTATGGAGGGYNYAAGGAGGTGSGGQVNLTGGTGTNGSTGGAAGFPAFSGGGGGGAGGCNGCTTTAGNDGKVVISLGTGTAKVPCVTLYEYGNSGCSSSSPSACPSGWTDGGCGLGNGGSAYIRTCYRCD